MTVQRRVVKSRLHPARRPRAKAAPAAVPARAAAPGKKIDVLNQRQNGGELTVPESLSGVLFDASAEALEFMRERIRRGRAILDSPNLPYFAVVVRGADAAAASILQTQVRVDNAALQNRREDIMERIIARLAEMDGEPAQNTVTTVTTVTVNPADD